MELVSLSQVSLESFSSLVGESFAITLDAQTTEAKLTQASPLPHRSSTPGVRQPFSLLFSIPESLPPRQSIYLISHPSLGSLELMLVPVGRDANGFQLEAIFN